MRITSLPKNIASYISFFALALLVGALESIHVQYQAHGSIDPMETLDATIAYVLPSLVLLLGSMKLPSVGHEAVAHKVESHEESLAVRDTVPPMPPRAEQIRQDWPQALQREARDV